VVDLLLIVRAAKLALVPVLTAGALSAVVAPLKPCTFATGCPDGLFQPESLAVSLAAAVWAIGGCCVVVGLWMNRSDPGGRRVWMWSALAAEAIEGAIAALLLLGWAGLLIVPGSAGIWTFVAGAAVPAITLSGLAVRWKRRHL
jgi:hypothetical protein